MKLPEMKWSKQNCIMCVLIILAIFLMVTFLFRHYTLIEGFSFGGFDSSSVTSSLPSAPTMPTMPTMPSLPTSFPSLSSSGWSNIGPIPADNAISSDTYSAFQTKFKEITTALAENAKTQGKNPPLFANASPPPVTELQKMATEDDVKYFISNGKWQYPNQMTQCITAAMKKAVIADATKNGKPAPTDAEIQDQVTAVVNSINIGMSPRQLSFMGLIGFGFGSILDVCLSTLRETVFIRQMIKIFGGDRSPVNSIYDLDKKDYYRISENKYLTCDLSAKAPIIKSWDETSKTVKTSPSSYDQFPTLVKGFNFITPVDKFDICNTTTTNGLQQSAFSFDNQAVSPFYQGFWGVPANSVPPSTNSQPATTATTTPSS